MDKTMQTNLCQGIRACGLPKPVSLEIVNCIQKWYDNNGEEWTNDRLKQLKQWYLSVLAGNPQPPAYHSHSLDGYPTGVWSYVFHLRNQAKALAVLSANTLFIEQGLISETQKSKLVKGLRGNSSRGEVAVEACQLVHTMSTLRQHETKCGPKSFPPLVPVTPEDMTGMSIPLVGGKKLRIRKSAQVDDRRKALLESWRSVPQETLDYLDKEDRLDLWPENYINFPDAPNVRATGRSVGQIGLIQEPQLKLRSVANPNRVAQAMTAPLALFWERGMQQYPSDCTFCQDKGVQWAQRKLADGVELAGSDLSSATDLLRLSECIKLASSWCLPYLRTDDNESVDRYLNAVEYFVNLSRGKWDTAKGTGLGRVSWDQGQPLGLYPSFRLLALTNNAVGLIAAKLSNLDPWDSFRVVGDDIIMDARMEEAYIRQITSIGGEVNRSKTLRSNKVAEFAGRIITPSRVMRKSYRFVNPSDDNFMSYVTDLGPQAAHLLLPRQRAQYELFKFVPGVVYEGPWSKDSFGQPLENRVAWAESTTLFEEAFDPDPKYLHLEQQLLRLALETADQEGTTKEEVLKDLPWPVDEDLQSSLISDSPKPSGDPRRKNGKSFLQTLEDVSGDSGFRPYTPKPMRVGTSSEDDQLNQDIHVQEVETPLGQVHGQDPVVRVETPEREEPDSGTCKGPVPARPLIEDRVPSREDLIKHQLDLVGLDKPRSGSSVGLAEEDRELY